MILFAHYSVSTFTNVYVLACPVTRMAVIIDPARFEAPVLDFIESEGLSLTAVLVTRPEEILLRGIGTLRKIYGASIYGGKPDIAGFPTRIPDDGDVLTLGMYSIEARTISPHVPDTRVFRCGHLLFSGPVLSAGTIIAEQPGYSGVLMRRAVRERLLSLPPETLVMPREGPPSTIGVERSTNIDLSPEPED
ncbi:MAG: hypothetical protein ACLFM6_02155 [Spirochaetaceae bacterium]